VLLDISGTELPDSPQEQRIRTPIKPSLSDLKNVPASVGGREVDGEWKRRNVVAHFSYSVSAREWLPGKPDYPNLVGPFGAPQREINVQVCHLTTQLQWQLTLSLVGDQRTVPKDREHQVAEVEARGAPGTPVAGFRFCRGAGLLLQGEDQEHPNAANLPVLFRRGPRAIDGNAVHGRQAGMAGLRRTGGNGWVTGDRQECLSHL